MPRSKEDITELCDEIRTRHIEDFGNSDYSLLKEVVADHLRKRMETFVSRRLGHLPNLDLNNFCEAFDAIRPVTNEVEFREYAGDAIGTLGPTGSDTIPDIFVATKRKPGRPKKEA